MVVANVPAVVRDQSMSVVKASAEPLGTFPARTKPLSGCVNSERQEADEANSSGVRFD
jgi:hypothetical protein